MLTICYEAWNQSPEFLRELALQHEHSRTRERFLALFEITTGKNATQISRETGRNHQTVMGWVHQYNKKGHESLFYRHTGGSLPLFCAKITDGLAGLINKNLELAATPPQTQREAVFTPRWTLKRLVAWVKEAHGLDCCRETVRKALKKLGFSWKKWRKLLNKANPKQREAFVDRLQGILAAATLGKEQVVYVDEAHIHLDSDEGYGWTVKGKRAWISSSSPGLAKVSFYGVYFYNEGKVQILPFERANGDNTLIVLKKIKEHFASNDKITLIWDGASYHRSAQVKQAVQDLNIKLEPLPAYSPDFMPVEHLWQWMREDVTYHTCYDHESKLIAQVEAFERLINAEPAAIADRLWTKTTLNSDEEKLRFSK